MAALYNDGKTATLTVTGNKKGKKEVYEFNINFKSFDNNDFIPNIWATKKVGFLLEAIRLNGEKSELVDEVKALAIKFAIVTPYTSYLVTEDMKKAERVDVRAQNIEPIHGAKRDTATLDDIGRRGTGFGGGGSGSSPMAKMEEKESGLMYDSVAFNSTSGETAVQTSKTLRKMKKSDKSKDNTYGKKVMGDKTFILKNGVWVDNYMDGKKAKPITVKLKYMSELYLKLLSKNAKLRKYLSVGENVTLYYGKYLIEIRSDYSGKENLPKGLK
jgi:Ca-activated chloride channel family protein